ncbi:MAG: beta-ketoacyl synthase chain length factor [Chitinophagaceae bacterium]
MYIVAASTISHQPTFRNPGFSKQITALTPPSTLISPDYNEFIPPLERRRMSDVMKMAIVCSIDCLEQTGLRTPDGIIVGTSMGCPIHTKKFLDKVAETGNGPLAPTSFIVSTHNTIAGQVALLLKNHSYNMTHTHGSLSFEQALTDGLLCIGDGYQNLLVGGADEEESTIYNMRRRIGKDPLHITCGASFFILSGNQSSNAIKLSGVRSYSLVESISHTIRNFLDSQNLSDENMDKVIFISAHEKTGEELKTIFGEEKLIDLLPLTGAWFTNAAFALHFAMDLWNSGENFFNILICKRFNKIIL